MHYPLSCVKIFSVIDTNIPIEKKIFFLSPHAVVREIIVDLIAEGYEVYVIDDRNILLKLLELFPDSIVFINFDIDMEHKWDVYLRKILNTHTIKNIRVGIFTFYKFKKEKFANYYIGEVGIQCGFIELHIEKNKCKELLLLILELNEAKGRRKYIRAIYDGKANFNLKYKNKLYTGAIKDISVAGMACFISLAEELLLQGQQLDDIQLILRGIRCRVTGKLLTVRKYNDRDCYIIMFDADRMDIDLKNKINRCVFLQIQETMKKIIQSAGALKND